MLGSPMELRYDDGDAVVLIQTDTGAARTGDGSAMGTTPVAHGPGNVAGMPEPTRSIIIRDGHGTEGGSITIVTPTNLKISINTKSSPGRRPTTVTVQSQTTEPANDGVTAPDCGTVPSADIPGTVIDFEPNDRCQVRFDDATQFEHPNSARCSQSQELRAATVVPVESPDTDPQPPTIQNTPICISPVRTIRFPPEFSSLVCTTQLPYDLNSLQWDANHQVNNTGNYCYCGHDGDWTREMIQCRRCEQWFHGRCVRSLQFPIFHGDTYYVFICSICNHGHEFVRRLVLNAANLVHLVLYNLIMRNGLRFYGLRTAIIPYIEDNQRTLQLSEQIMKLSTQERTDLLVQALKSNRERFLNGKEFALPPQLWTLRQPVPPPKESITIPIPATEIVTESILQQMLDITEQFRFLPRVYHERNYFIDGATRERMLGLGYAVPPESVEDPRIALAYCASAPSATVASIQQQSTTNLPAIDTALPGTSGGDALVGARRRKRFGIRPTPIAELVTGDGLDSLIPLPADFNGPNHPFYEEESSSASSGNGKTRSHYPESRKTGSTKRRTFDIKQKYQPNAKRRMLRHSDAASPKEEIRGLVVRKRPMSTVFEESPNTLSWDNVQRHNKRHSMDTDVFTHRASATCSTSSRTGEQVDATPARSTVSNASTVEEKPLASGRRSSGRLIALKPINYSETRCRNKHRHEDTPVSASEEPRPSTSGLRSIAYGDDDGDPTDHLNGYRLTASELALTDSDADSSCCLYSVYWDPEILPDPITELQSMPAADDTSQQQNRPNCVVMGKRTLPDGQKELLLEFN